MDMVIESTLCKALKNVCRMRIVILKIGSAKIVCDKARYYNVIIFPAVAGIYNYLKIVCYEL